MLRFFKTIWLLVKLGLFIGLIAFLVLQEGTTRLQFGPYELNMHTGILLATALVFMLVLATVLNWLGAVGRLPSYFKRKRERRHHKKGLEALASGFGALAAGDGKRARKWAGEAKGLLRDDGASLSTMLEGLAAKQSGDVAGAERAFSSLLSANDTMSFGLRGLMSMAGEDGQTQRALVLAREAMRQKGADKTGLNTVIYTLSLREKDWAQAEEALNALVKTGQTEKARGREELCALKLARAQTISDSRVALPVAKAAFDLNPDSTAAALLVVKHAMNLGETKTVQRTIEAIWPRAPHPELAEVWLNLMAAKHIEKQAAQIAFVETLVKLNPRSTYSHLAYAEWCLKQGLVGQARHAAQEAAALRLTPKVAQLQARLNEAEGQSLAARDVLANALNNGTHEGWVCRVTGRSFTEWQPVVWPDALVGTVVYREDTRDIVPVQQDNVATSLRQPTQLLSAF